MTIDASNLTVIDALNISASISVSASGGSFTMTASAAAAIARNDVSTDVTGGVVRGDLTAGGFVDIDVVSGTSIIVKTIAATVAVAAGSGTSFSFTGAGASAKNIYSGVVQALVEDSSITAVGAVSIDAVEQDGTGSYLATRLTEEIVDVGANTIYVGDASGFEVGDRVVYSNGNADPRLGTNIGGLVDTVTVTDDNDTLSELKDDEIEDDPDVYWVVSKVDGKIQLSATNGGPVINLTTNSHGGSQTLSAYDGAEAVTGTAVRIGDPGGEGREIAIIDTGDDSIYVGDAAGLVTGDEVVYSSNGRPVIGGLEEGETYFVIDAQDGRIRLAETLLDANNGDAIDLTSAGPDGGHTLTKGVQIIDLFAPLEVSGTKMQSTVIAASVGVAAGSGGASAAVTVSVTEAKNESTGVTEALVTGSDVSGSNVSVSADASGEISVVGVAASISAGVSSSVAVSVTVSAVVIDNEMNNTVSAEVAGGEITSSSGVSVTAEDNSKIDAVGVAASVAISVGSTASIAAGVLGLYRGQRGQHGPVGISRRRRYGRGRWPGLGHCDERDRGQLGRGRGRRERCGRR